MAAQVGDNSRGGLRSEQHGERLSIGSRHAGAEVVDRQATHGVHLRERRGSTSDCAACCSQCGVRSPSRCAWSG